MANPWLDDIMRTRMKLESGQGVEDYGSDEYYSNYASQPPQSYRGFGNPWLEKKYDEDVVYEREAKEDNRRLNEWSNTFVDEKDTSLEPLFEDYDLWERFKYPEGDNYYNEPSEPGYDAWAKGVAPNAEDTMYPKQHAAIKSLYSYSREMGDDSVKRIYAAMRGEINPNELTARELKALDLAGARANKDDALLAGLRVQQGLKDRTYNPSEKDKELSSRIFSGFHGKVSPEKLYEYLKEHLRDKPNDHDLIRLF